VKDGKMLDRRDVLKAGVAAGALVAIPGWARPVPSGLDAMFDTFFAEGLRLRPESATLLGLDKGANADLRGKLSDASRAGQAASKALTQSQIKRLATVDVSALSAAEKVNYDVVRYTRKAAAAAQAFDFGSGRSPYAISQQDGAYQSTPNFLDTKHPIETASDADAYLARLAAFGKQLDDDTAQMKHDVAMGVIPPDFLIAKTLIQLTATRLPAAQATVVASLQRRAAAKRLEARYGADAAKIYDERILPALDRQIAAVKAAQTKATHDAGVWKLKQGEAFYRVALEGSTTTRLTPQEVHEFGLDQAKAIGARITALMDKAGVPGGPLGKRLASLYKLPGQLFPDTDEGKVAAIAYCNDRLDAIRGRLPQVFKRIPPYKFEVRRVPKEIEAGAASAYSQGPAPDGSRPGLVYFNLHDSAEWPKFMLATVIYHEGLPGHQFEGGLALSNTALPMIRKSIGFSGYAEGWALYAEQIADELGMYDGDPLGQIGYLKEALFRAHRCIIDTGLHNFRWSRERAMALFVDGQGEAPGFAEREIDRYCASPGQACSYKLGHSTIVKLRDKAKAAQGDRFDIKEFHEAVLANGRLPLEMLEQTVGAWIRPGA
jgi:uncharacterized protein (DUF885 family)